MQANGGFEFPKSFGLESRHMESYCAGYQDSPESAFGRDTISIKGIADESSRMKNPQFLAVLEERIVSGLI
ncbi:MAG: hypothetical protein FJX76_03105 [Armatimonadetes bacterium]|nr:hypothetical protein [Armatimonadota bacterium]